MGRDINIISETEVVDGVVYVAYIRPDDGTRWAYRCFVNRTANTILWGLDDGRWRSHPDDSSIHFQVGSNQLKIIEQFNDGTSSTDSFSLY